MDGLLRDYNARDLTAPAWKADAPKSLVAEDWNRSVWTDRRVLQCRATQASVHAVLVHYRADGSEISRQAVIYVVGQRGGAWEITGRSANAI